MKKTIKKPKNNRLETLQSKKNLWAILLIGVILCVSLVSTTDLANTKDYDSTKKEYTITANLGAGQELAKMKLITPQNFNVIDRGEGVLQMVAEVEFVNYVKQSNALSKMQFYNERNRETSRYYEYRWRVKTGTKQIPSTNYICKENNRLDDKDCYNITGYSEEEIYSKWIRFNDVSELPEGTVRVGIFTDVKNDDNMEWIPTWYGERLDAWAGWSSSLNTNLKSFITFNESVLGVKGSYNNTVDFTHHNATTNGTTSVTGIIGNAVNLTTVRSQVNFTHPISWWNATTNQTTVSFWVNGSNDESSLSYILHWGNTPDTPILFIRTTGGTTTVACAETGTEFSFSGARWIKNETWTHVVLQIDNNWTGGSNGEVTLWINGTLVGNDTTTSVNLSKTTTEFFLIGGRTGTLSFVGGYDEFGYWDRILSPDEIKDLYNEHKGLTYNQNFFDINITYPIGNTDYLRQIYYLNYTTTLNNSCWWSNSSGVWNSSTVVAGTNFTVSNNVTAVIGSNSWTVYCNDTSNFVEDKTVNFDYGWFEVNITYNTTTTELARERFVFNLTYDNDSLTITNPTFTYNGTTYTAEVEGSGINPLIVSAIDIPLITGNKKFWFNFSIGSSFFGSSNKTQDVSAIYFGLCDATYTIKFVNYTVYDEGNLSVIHNATFDSTFKYSISSTGTQKNASFSLINNTNYEFCGYPNRTFYVEADIGLEKSGYSSRNYFFDTTYYNKTFQQPLYLLNSSDSTDVALILKDAGLTPLENYIIKVYRLRESTGSYDLVENDKTDNFGQIMAKLEENDVRYKIEIYNPSGVLVKLINNNIVVCRSTVLCSQTFIIEDTTNPFDYQVGSTNYTYTLEFSNNTNIFSFVWVDNLDTSSEHRMEVVRHSILNGSTSLCNTTSSLDSGVLTCNVGSDRYSYTASAYRRSNGIEKRVGVITAKVGNLSSTFGMEGLFWSLILLVSAALIGIFYPPVAVILYVGGMFLLGIFDIIYVSPALIIAEIVLGVLFVWSFRG